MVQDTGNEWVTRNEAADLLGVHKNTITHRIKTGVYPEHKVLTPNGEAYVLPRELIAAEARGEAPQVSKEIGPSAVTQNLRAVTRDLRRQFREDLTEVMAPVMTNLEQTQGVLAEQQAELAALRRDVQALHQVPRWLRWLTTTKKP